VARHFRLYILFAAFQFLYISTSEAQLIGYQLEGNRKKASFSFEIYNNLIIIPVTINKRIPLKFILDTGVSSAILFDKQFTDLIGINYSRKITVFGVGEEKVVQAFVATEMQLSLPMIEGHRQSLLVLEEDYLELDKQIGAEVHGIIGYELFSRFIVEIDYPDKRITFWDPQHFKPKRKRNWEKIEMNVLTTKPFVNIPISISGGEKFNGNFLIDTGASHALLIHHESNDELYLPEKKLPSVLGKGLTGTIYGHLARIGSMDLGKFEFKDVIVSFPDEDSYSDSLVNIEKNGTIGGEIFTRFRVVIDYLNEVLYLRRTKLVDDDFEYNMSGLEVIADGPDLDRLKIISVREGSPADSVDIKKDDIILSINGLTGESLTLSAIYKIFNSRPHKRVKIFIQRDEEKLRKRFYLRKDL